MKTIRQKVRTLVVPFLFFNLVLVAALFLAQRLGVLSGQRLDLLTLVEVDAVTRPLYNWQARQVLL